MPSATSTPRVLFAHLNADSHKLLPAIGSRAKRTPSPSAIKASAQPRARHPQPRASIGCQNHRAALAYNRATLGCAWMTTLSYRIIRSAAALGFLAIAGYVSAYAAAFGPSNPFYAPSALPFSAPPFDRIKD